MPVEPRPKDHFSLFRLGPHLCRCLLLVTAALWLVDLAAAQTLSVVYNFGDGDSGAPQYVIPAQGRDGRLYGTSSGVGTAMGSIYSISTTGQADFLTAFDGTNGAKPFGGLTLGADGSFYGVAFEGGAQTLVFCSR